MQSENLLLAGSVIWSIMRPDRILLHYLFQTALARYSDPPDALQKLNSLVSTYNPFENVLRRYIEIPWDDRINHPVNARCIWSVRVLGGGIFLLLFLDYGTLF